MTCSGIVFPNFHLHNTILNMQGLPNFPHLLDYVEKREKVLGTRLMKSTVANNEWLFITYLT